MPYGAPYGMRLSAGKPGEDFRAVIKSGTHKNPNLENADSGIFLDDRERGWKVLDEPSAHACHTPYPASRNPIASSTSMSRAPS